MAKTSINSIYTFIPLFLVLIIDAMGTGLVFPILSPIYLQVGHGILPAATSEAVRNFLYGLTMAGFSFAMFFSAPLLGDISDQLGRKKVLLICLIGTGVCFFISAIGIEFNSIFLLILGRIISGFCAGCQPIAQAAITDISDEKNKAFNLGLISTAFSIGFVIGPIMGGFFSDPLVNKAFDFSTPFFIATVLSLGNALCLWFAFKETYYPKTQYKIDYLKGFKIFLSAFERKDLRLLVAVYFTWEIAWTLYFQYMSLYLVHAYQFSPARIGLYMSLIGVVFALNMTAIVPIVLRYLKLEMAVLVGLILLCLGMSATVLFQSEWMQWALAAPINIGTGVAYATHLALFSNRVDKHSQGWIMGVIAAVASMAWFISGLVIGPLATIHIITPFIMASILLLLSAMGMYYYIQQLSHQ